MRHHVTSGPVIRCFVQCWSAGRPGHLPGQLCERNNEPKEMLVTKSLIFDSKHMSCLGPMDFSFATIISIWSCFDVCACQFFVDSL